MQIILLHSEKRTLKSFSKVTKNKDSNRKQKLISLMYSYAYLVFQDVFKVNKVVAFFLWPLSTNSFLWIILSDNPYKLISLALCLLPSNRKIPSNWRSSFLCHLVNLTWNILIRITQRRYQNIPIHLTLLSALLFPHLAVFHAVTIWNLVSTWGLSFFSFFEVSEHIICCVYTFPMK